MNAPGMFPRRSVRAEDVGKRVRLLDGVYLNAHAVGTVLDYSAAPSITIETDSGERISWRADLAEVVTTEPDPYDGKTLAEVIYDYAVVRGDLSEQYARDQLARIIERRVERAIEAPVDGGNW